MEELTGDLSKEEPAFIDITWKIHNFLDKPGTVDFCLKSPSFSFENAIWQLELYPNGRNYNYCRGLIDLFRVDMQPWIHLRVARLTSSVPDHKISAKWFFKTCLGKDSLRSFTMKFFEHDKNKVCDAACFFTRSQIMNKEEILLPNGTLTVCLQMLAESFSENESPESCSPLNQSGGVVSPKKSYDASSETFSDGSARMEVRPEISPTVHKLQSDYKKLLESEEEADVCLRVSDKEFRAHKCILRARSAVFSAMFKHDTEERASGEVVIEDLDPESFPDFLQHVYAGGVDTLSEENVFNLYTAADKYDMMDLKSECKSYMERTLSVDTFCNVMIWALRYKEDELLKLATDFFCKNLTKIIVTVKWQMFSKEYNTEANELFIKALVPVDTK